MPAAACSVLVLAQLHRLSITSPVSSLISPRLSSFTSFHMPFSCFIFPKSTYSRRGLILCFPGLISFSLSVTLHQTTPMLLLILLYVFFPKVTTFCAGESLFFFQFSCNFSINPSKTIKNQHFSLFFHKVSTFAGARHCYFSSLSLSHSQNVTPDHQNLQLLLLPPKSTYFLRGLDTPSPQIPTLSSQLSPLSPYIISYLPPSLQSYFSSISPQNHQKTIKNVNFQPRAKFLSPGSLVCL